MKHCKQAQASAGFGLEYIANSPSREHGGFHRNAVQTARAAIAQISLLKQKIKRLKQAK